MRYKDAGVDIERGKRFAEVVRSLAEGIPSPRVRKGIGGFCSLVELDPSDYKKPLIAAATDGVGTKLKIAFAMRRFDTVGIDLVAMCVNDIITAGAKPLFFLDYFATSRLEIDKGREVMAGILKGCEEAGCPLVGGETAEMPGFYREGEFDLAGFAVGVVEADRVIDGREISPGDAVIGLASSGLHSNGFSLVRRLLLEEKGMRLEQWVEELGCPLGVELLRPTRIYVKSVLRLLESFPIKGIAHITGGGIPGNLSRILPPGRRAVVKKGRWPIPPIYSLIEGAGVEEEEMWRTFNQGRGMILVCPEEAVDPLLEEVKEEAFLIGEIREGEGVEIEGV